jgi:hypothetical protein
LDNNIATCIDHFFADRTVQRILDLARKTRPLQICFPREVPVSRFLAWIFDPAEGHGLQDAVIRSMLTAAWNVREEVALDLVTRRLLSPAQLSTRSFNGCMIQKEVRIVEGMGQLDVLIMHPQSKLLIAVENKFGAGEGQDQLKRYRKALAKRYPDWDRIHIFLDLYGQSPKDTGWIGLDFEWLVDELRVAERSPWLGEEPRRVLREFRSSIEVDGDTYDHLALHDSELIDIVQQHKPVLQVMESWQREGLKLPDLVDKIFSKGSTLRDKALQQLLPAYWRRTDLWRTCIGMLSYANFYAAAREKFDEVLRIPHRKAFYFALPLWLGIVKEDSKQWPLHVMVRILPPNAMFDHENFVIVSRLVIDEVHDDWNEKLRELAANLRERYLKKNRKLGEDQGRISLCVDAVGTEAEAITALVNQITNVNTEMMRLLSST